MIDGIRRRLTKSIEGDAWDADKELEPEVEESSELLPDTAEVESARILPAYSPGDGNLAEYYKSIVKTAIDNDGKYGDHQISVPWLRMILAGLEYRPIEPEMTWYGVETDALANHPPEIPSYDDLFPSERGVSAGPGSS